jgi:GST-like protein
METKRQLDVLDQRLAQTAARPAAQRGRMVNRTGGDPARQLHERHETGDFDTMTQDKLAPAT